MPHGRRKVPFSGKKKKEQLCMKRQNKGFVINKKYGDSDDSDDGPLEDNVQKVNAQPFKKQHADVNRFNLQFHKESKAHIASMKDKARLPLQVQPQIEREIDFSYFDGFDFPTRPPWDYTMSKERLQFNENKYFTNYVKQLEKRNQENPLSVFELNLETWRQLWRVLELSDIILIIVDVRYAAFLYPPSLFKYITEETEKRAILILNKIDLVAADLVLAWKHYFLENYAGLSVVCFASYPATLLKGLKKGKRKANFHFASNGVYNIYKECKKLVDNEVDLASWEQKILEDFACATDDLDGDSTKVENTHKESYEFDFEKPVKYKNGILTIGCIGFPNVGKSSIINALKGRKVVSVSRTPGHTKHFQTIFLTENVKLCDCPGLVFPSAVPKYIQIILGSYPIAQVREPYSTLRYVGERINIPEILALKLPPDYNEWSPIALCEAWACKRGFLTAKAARPDYSRAANNILRMILDGKIVIEFYPKKYLEKNEYWKSHPELQEIIHTQFGKEGGAKELGSSAESSSESETDNCASEEEEIHPTESNSGRRENIFSMLQEE